MADEATVDCYNGEEQTNGFLCAMDEALSMPFKTSVLGVTVTVRQLDVTLDGVIVAVCQRDGVRQRIPLLELPLPDPPPVGAEWIEDYRQWKV